MKALSFRRVSLLIGLAVGLMVLWAATAPSKITEHSILGAYHPTSPGGCCINTVNGWCTLETAEPFQFSPAEPVV